MRVSVRGLLLLAAMCVGTVAALAAPADVFAATFTVNNTNDFDDETPGDGACRSRLGDARVNRCSLRAAIQEANALPGDDTIVLEGGKTYDLSEETVGGGRQAETITSSVTISRTGFRPAVVNLQRPLPALPIWHILTSGTVRMTGLTISGGGGLLIANQATCC